MDAELLHADFGVLVARGTLAAGRTRDGGGLAAPFDGLDEPFRPRRGGALRPARRAHGRHAGMLRAPGGEIEQQLIVEYLEDGEIDRLGLLFAPMPELLDDGQRLGREKRGTADAPVVFGVVLAHRFAGLNHAGARLLVPGAAALVIKLRAERFGDGLKIFGVLHGVVDHGLRERAAGPVGLLAALVERDAAKLLDQRAVTEGL